MICFYGLHLNLLLGLYSFHNLFTLFCVNLHGYASHCLISKCQTKVLYATKMKHFCLFENYSLGRNSRITWLNIFKFEFLGLNPQVQIYLEEHLLKSLTPRSQLLNRPAIRKGGAMRRRMSVKGAIKKTRSIAVERKYQT